MNIKKFIPEYEAMIGKKLPTEVVGIIERIDTIGQKFVDKGCKDAAQGLPVPSGDAFREWSGKLVQDKTELLEELAGLLRLYYMDGYEARTKRGQMEVPA